MKSYKSQATDLGILFVAVRVTGSIGFALISPIINTSDFLYQVNNRKTILLIGSLFEFIEILCVIGIVVTLFPMMRKFNERFALWYSSVRILEAVTLLVIVLSCLILIPLSDLYVQLANAEIPTMESIGKLLVLVHEKWTNLPVSIFYCTSAIVIQFFFIKTKLIPLFISIWGLISAILLLIVAPFEVLGFEYLGLVGISMGLNEIFLGIWLIIKGFNEVNILSHPTRKASDLSSGS